MKPVRSRGKGKRRWGKRTLSQTSVAKTSNSALGLEQVYEVHSADGPSNGTESSGSTNAALRDRNLLTSGSAGNESNQSYVSLDNDGVLPGSSTMFSGSTTPLKEGTSLTSTDELNETTISEERGEAGRGEFLRRPGSLVLNAMKHPDQPFRHKVPRNRKRRYSAHFDPETLLKHINATLSHPELDLEEFLNIFRSVNGLFNSLGPVFTFVVSEMDEKLDTLDNLRRSKNKDNYRTVEGMVRYESDNNLIEGNAESGVRMQQRLHRSLPFIAELLTKLDTVGPEEYLYPFVREVYMRTLSAHHSWVVRKTITFALRALPKRKELENMIIGSDEKNMARWRELSPSIEKGINKVYAKSDTFYKKYNVPELP